jgi:hypothetical protein
MAPFGKRPVRTGCTGFRTGHRSQCPLSYDPVRTRTFLEMDGGPATGPGPKSTPTARRCAGASRPPRARPGLPLGFDLESRNRPEHTEVTRHAHHDRNPQCSPRDLSGRHRWRGDSPHHSTPSPARESAPSGGVPLAAAGSLPGDRHGTLLPGREFPPRRADGRGAGEGPVLVLPSASPLPGRRHRPTRSLRNLGGLNPEERRTLTPVPAEAAEGIG